MNDGSARVDDDHVGGETRATAEHNAFGRNYPRSAVKHQIILPADGVATDDRQTDLSRACNQKRGVLRIFPRDKRTCARNGDHGGAVGLGVGDGVARIATHGARITGLPEILAQQRRNALARVVDHHRVRAGREVAVFVEDVVARKQLLGGVAFDSTTTQHRERVGEGTTARLDGQANEGKHRRGNQLGEPRHRRLARLHHTMALDEIARRIAEDRHLRKHQELRTRRDRAGDCIGVLDFVGGEIADFRVDLGQCDLQRAGSYDARAQRDAGRAG